MQFFDANEEAPERIGKTVGFVIGFGVYALVAWVVFTSAFHH